MSGDREASAGVQPCTVHGAVIDTNVWLDLYWFRDPAAQPLAQALEAQAVRALRSERTDAELRAVLARPQFQGAAAGSDEALASGERNSAILERWYQCAQAVQTTRAAPWACRDPDDQKFLDLAWSAGASVLLTKDRDLLDLAHRARRAGLCITGPREFSLAQLAGGGLR